MGRTNRVPVPPLAVHLWPLVTIDGVIANQAHRPVGDEAVEHQPHQRAAQFEPGPRGALEHSLVAGAVPGGEVAQGAEQVGHGAPTGGQHRADQERREPLVRRVGEREHESTDQGPRLGW